MTDQVNRGHMKMSKSKTSETWHKAPRQSPVTPPIRRRK
jgi:hypothetical protein